ncbi:MAG: RDD family protein [Candidatus Limnocylindrales bacterium]
MDEGRTGPDWPAGESARPAEPTEPEESAGPAEAAEAEASAASPDEPEVESGWPAPEDGSPGAWQLREPLRRAAGEPRAGSPAPGVVYAEFGLRLVAFAIDLALVWVGTSIVAAFTLPAIRSLLRPADATTTDTVPETVGVALIAIVLLSGAAYSLAVLRGSPGQLAMGLATLGRGRGGQLPLVVAAVRQLLLYGPVFLVPLLGVLAPLFTSDQDMLAAVETWLPLGFLAWYLLLAVTALASPRGQGLHDLVVGSVVVREVDEA